MLIERKTEVLSTADIDAIVAISSASLIEEVDNPIAGFLTRVPSGAEISRLSTNSNCLVSKHGDQVSGFISFFKAESKDPILQETLAKFSVIEWQTSPPKIENLVYLDQIVIAPNFRRQGIAFTLLQSVIELFPESNFLVAIIEEPFCNLASAELVRKFGFDRIGERKLDEYRGLRPFRSAWYYRSDS